MSTLTNVGAEDANDDSHVIADSDDATPAKPSHFRPTKTGWLTRATAMTLVTFGVAMRVWILRSPIGAADSDESVVGLMARALLHGDPSIFYWGQAYGGSQESVLGAGLFSIIGSSVLAMKMVPVLLSVLAAILLWRVGKRTVGDQPAAVGAALFWATPFSFVWLSTKERGFYESTMVFSLIVMLCALNLRERPTYRVAAIGGLALGLGMWASPQSAYLVVPSVLWLIVRRPSAIRTALVAIPAAVIGVAPAILYNLRTGWTSFTVPHLDQASTFSQRLQRFFTDGIPLVLGVKVPYTLTWVAPVIGYTVCALAAFGLAVGVLWCLRNIRTGAGGELLIASVLLYPFIFAASPFSFYVADPRYLYFLSAPVALLIAWGLHRVRPVGAIAAMVLCAVSMTSILHWSDRWNHHDLTTDALGPVDTTLAALQANHVYADYWIAYRITMATDDRITAAPTTEIRRDQIQAVVDKSAGVPPYVVFPGSAIESELVGVAQAKGIQLDRYPAGHYVIYTPRSRITPSDLSYYAGNHS